jgi:D-ribulokinase
MEAKAEPPLWVGIDLGTQSVRVTIADGDGRVLGFGSALLDSSRPEGPGRLHEQDPQQWWAAVGIASRQAFAALPESSRRVPVGGLAICSTSGTVLLTDDEANALTPALMYDDARAVDELARLHDRGAATEGSGDVQLSWALPKISWLLEHHHDSGGYVAHSADYVAAALVGHRVDTDNSHALKSGYDPMNDQWNAALLAAAGVDPSVLPTVVRPGTVLGTVSQDAHAHTGIPRGTPVVAGMTDGCAAQIASGSLAVGSWNTVLGTTLVLKGVSERPVLDGGAVYNHRHPDGGWLPGGASNVGAGVVAEEFPDADFEALNRVARRFEPASCVIYPLTARGERFPFVRDDAVRLSAGRASEPAERYAAILQGVAFVERMCFEHLAAIGADVSGDISATGGATRNDYWNQLRADVLDRALMLPASPEPSFGMAVLASAQRSSVTERARRMVARRSVVEPRPGMHERLSTGYERLLAELRAHGYIEETLLRQPNGSNG